MCFLNKGLENKINQIYLLNLTEVERLNPYYTVFVREAATKMFFLPLKVIGF